MHCVAVTEDGEVLAWGKNDQGQLGEESRASFTEPATLPGLEGRHIIGAACGPAQVTSHQD